MVAPLCPAFLKRVDFYKAHDAVSRRDDTKSITPIINESFVASSGDIITDYNDSYGLTITMSAFVIGGTTNTTLHSSKLV